MGKQGKRTVKVHMIENIKLTIEELEGLEIGKTCLLLRSAVVMFPFSKETISCFF